MCMCGGKLAIPINVAFISFLSHFCFLYKIEIIIKSLLTLYPTFLAKLILGIKAMEVHRQVSSYMDRGHQELGTEMVGHNGSTPMPFFCVHLVLQYTLGLFDLVLLGVKEN